MTGMVDLSGKKGSKINGIVEEYVAKGNISAGGFVKYLNECNARIDKELISKTHAGYRILAVKLSENIVLVVYKNVNKMFGAICIINNDNITIETDTQLIDAGTASNFTHSISIIRLSNEKVLITYTKGTNYLLYGTVFTINNTTITVGAETQLSTDENSGYSVSGIKLLDNKILIVYSKGNTYTKKLYGMICTVSGTTITKKTDISLDTMSISGDYKNILLLQLNENKIFIAHMGTYIFGKICTINENNITVGENVQLTTYSESSGGISALKLNENKIFITCGSGGGSTGHQLHGIICTVEGDTITVATDTQLSEIPYTGLSTSLAMITENQILIIHSYTNAYYLYAMTCEINGTNITVKADIQLSIDIYSGYEMSNVLKLGNEFFIGHGISDLKTISDYVYGMLIEHFFNGAVQTATQADKIYRCSTSEGIRRTSRQGRKTKLFRGGKIKCI